MNFTRFALKSESIRKVRCSIKWNILVILFLVQCPNINLSSMLSDYNFVKNMISYLFSGYDHIRSIWRNCWCIRKYMVCTYYICKVHIFWEGHKILRNLHLTFVLCSVSQKLGGDFAKFCGLLRIYELYENECRTCV